jgi:hypothetical protein
VYTALTALDTTGGWSEPIPGDDHSG